jgi:SAM-dependent methyltransferase
MDAELYDELYRVEQTHWWFRARRHIVWSLVRRYVGGGANRRLNVCELGCGTGGNLAAIADEHDIVGVECSPYAMAHAQKSLGSRIRYGSLPNEIDLPPSSFDVVLMTDVLEHFDNYAGSACSALGLVRPGGIVVATVPAYQWLYARRDMHHHHRRRYGKRRFEELWKTPGAQTVFVSHYNALLFLPAAIVRLTSKILPTHREAGDLSLPSRSINDLLAQVMRCETNLLGRLPLPFGLSLIAVIRKTEAVPSSRLRFAA